MKSPRVEREAARALARELDLDTDERGCLAGTDLVLWREDDGLVLLEHGQTLGRGVATDFASIDVRTGSGALSRKQPLARAFGRSCKTIIDATAGLGHDAFLLAALGYRVTAIERAPAVAELLADGVRRALADPRMGALLGDRLQVRRGDSCTLLAQEPPADAIYLDPMYPPKRKRSALAPKAIRMIRQLAGNDPDAAQLWQTAHAARPRRIVVKRPLHAEPLGSDTGTVPAPDSNQKGKLARYDVYLL